jgi:hypothetical protein
MPLSKGNCCLKEKEADACAFDIWARRLLPESDVWWLEHIELHVSWQLVLNADLRLVAKDDALMPKLAEGHWLLGANGMRDHRHSLNVTIFLANSGIKMITKKMTVLSSAQQCYVNGCSPPASLMCS